MKHISKHWNKISSEPENMFEIIQVEGKKEVLKNKDQILKIPTYGKIKI